MKLKLFHGSGKTFDKFDLSKYKSGADSGAQSWYGKGLYFSGEAWKAASYARAAETGGQVYTVEASASNPFVVKGTGFF